MKKGEKKTPKGLEKIKESIKKTNPIKQPKSKPSQNGSW